MGYNCCEHCNHHDRRQVDDGELTNEHTAPCKDCQTVQGDELGPFVDLKSDESLQNELKGWTVTLGGGAELDLLMLRDSNMDEQIKAVEEVLKKMKQAKQNAVVKEAIELGTAFYCRDCNRFTENQYAHAKYGTCQNCGNIRSRGAISKRSIALIADWKIVGAESKYEGEYTKIFIEKDGVKKQLEIVSSYVDNGATIDLFDMDDEDPK